MLKDLEENSLKIICEEIVESNNNRFIEIGRWKTFIVNHQLNFSSF